jgi:hypothetical protein
LAFRLQPVSLKCINSTAVLAAAQIRVQMKFLVGTGDYEQLYGIGRLLLFQTKPLATAAQGRLRVHLGYDLRGLSWRADVAEPWAFGVVLDVIWSVRDDNGRASTPKIAEYGAMAEIARIQGEFLPGTNRINTEVARQRFQEHIVPFVQRFAKFPLPCGDARLDAEPVRVILGGGTES